MRVVKINTKKCNLCKLCVEYCPAYVFMLKDKSIEVDSDKCIECYGCIPLCPVQAITIEISENALVDFIDKVKSLRNNESKI